MSARQEQYFHVNGLLKRNSEHGSKKWHCDTIAVGCTITISRSFHRRVTTASVVSLLFQLLDYCAAFTTEDDFEAEISQAIPRRLKPTF